MHATAAVWVIPESPAYKRQAGETPAFPGGILVAANGRAVKSVAFLFFRNKLPVAK
jgi:hypothetical protein